MSKKDKLKKEIQDAVAAESKIDRKKQYEDFNKAMAQALYYFIEENKFIGSMLQEMYFECTHQKVPTAALTFDKKTKQFKIMTNPDFFLSMNLDHRVGVLHHEVLHFTNKHLLRFANLFSDKEKAKLCNIAADMSINQYIKSLPEGCVDVAKFKLKDGKPFPRYKSTDVYLELLQDPEVQEANKDIFKKYEEGKDGNDVHPWEDLSEEEKKELAEEMKKLIKRTMEKTQYDMSTIPESIRDLLQELNVITDSFNAKKILQDAIRKHATHSDRKSSWKRPNKRFGNVAPGTTNGDVPRLTIYSDTSGSRSHTEINMDLQIIAKFLKNGERKCDLGLWHTNLYRKRKFRLNDTLLSSEIEAGGTSINPVVDDINKSKPDLAIVLTDGYYDWNGVKPQTETIVIIVDNGTVDHPMSKITKTITVKNLKKT